MSGRRIHGRVTSSRRRSIAPTRHFAIAASFAGCHAATTGAQAHLFFVTAMHLGHLMILSIVRLMGVGVVARTHPSNFMFVASMKPHFFIAIGLFMLGLMRLAHLTLFAPVLAVLIATLGLMALAHSLAFIGMPAVHAVLSHGSRTHPTTTAFSAAVLFRSFRLRIILFLDTAAMFTARASVATLATLSLTVPFAIATIRSALSLFFGHQNNPLHANGVSKGDRV
jgi:hypothetical protein